MQKKTKRIMMADPVFSEATVEAVSQVLRSGWISQGPMTEKFETHISAKVNSEFAVAMNNGTATLHAALLAGEIGPGDEVIVPSLTYISSINAIIYTGAKPVLVDCDLTTFNVTPRSVEEAITSKTKGFMTVDMKGMPVDYRGFRDLASRKDLFFISDSAEALGALYLGNPVGAQADLHSFSFFANKNLTTGEGGCLTGANINGNYPDLEQHLRVLRNQGQSPNRYIHDTVGYNYRLTDLQATIGLSGLEELNGKLSHKQKIADYYSQNLERRHFNCPVIPDYVTQHAWFSYCLTFQENGHRNRVKAALEEHGIETRVTFPPGHLQPCYDEITIDVCGSMNNSEWLYNHMLDIPCHDRLSHTDISRVVEVINSTMDSL